MARRGAVPRPAGDVVSDMAGIESELTPVDPGGQYAVLLREVRGLRVEVRGAVNRSVVEHQALATLAGRVAVLESRAMLVPASVAILALVVATVAFGGTQLIGQDMEQLRARVLQLAAVR